MNPRKRRLQICLWAAVVLLIAALLIGFLGRTKSVLYAAFIVTALLLIAAVLIRFLVIPRFQMRPGKLQMLLEAVVGRLDRMGKRDRPQRNVLGGIRAFFSKAAAFMGTLLRMKSTQIGLAAALVLLVAALLIGSAGRAESIQEAMRDAVLHDTGRVSLLGIKDINPGLLSAFLVTAILLIASALIRFLVIPRFQMVPGKLQTVLEEAVGLFDRMAKSNSPHRNGFLGLYIFSAGAFIFVGTLFELLGLQAVTVHGHPITLPAPLSDVNGAIALGCLSYLVIVSGGIAGNGPKGIFKALKEFSLPISMSFRLFGALLSGLLVTELVYYFVNLSFVLPVVVGVLFTLLHALVQSYVLTMLTALYYGEVSEPGHKS